MPTEYHSSAEGPASLEEETKTTIEEARMVLPGIQALFGFQLIAVFNTRFHDFTGWEQTLHLVALLLVAFAIALIMTPAAYHRIAERGIVSRRFVDLASRFLELALMPLMLGISLDLFLLGRLILNNVAVKRRNREHDVSRIFWSLVCFPMDAGKKIQEGKLRWKTSILACFRIC